MKIRCRLFENLGAKKKICCLCKKKKPDSKFVGQNRTCEDCKNKKSPETILNDKFDKLWKVIE